MSSGERQKLSGGFSNVKSSKDAALLEAPAVYGSLEDFAADAGQRLHETAKWFETSDDTDPVKFASWCFECDDFKGRKVKAPLVAVWLLLQALGIIYQCRLLNEVTKHLDEYEANLALHCPLNSPSTGFLNPSRTSLSDKSICVGPSWNMSYSGSVSFGAQANDNSDFDFVVPLDQSFNFVTRSEPVTFLLGVEPQQPHPEASWRVNIKEQGSSKELPATWGSGSKYSVVTAKDRNEHAWAAHVVLRSNYKEPMTINFYVLDAVIQHLEEIHRQATSTCRWGPAVPDSYVRGNGRLDSKVFQTLEEAQLACGSDPACGGITRTAVGTTSSAQYELREGTSTAKSPTNETSWLITNGGDCRKGAQCSVEGSWTNFNARHNGQHHRVLSWTRRAICFFIIVALACFGFVFYRFLYYVDSGKLLSRIIVVKFFIQDLPLQMCIVAYLYGWYASDGLRCQMCLFQPLHCDQEYPLHWNNFWVCFFTLLSASANQILIQAKIRNWDPEEECCLGCIRCAVFSISTLPFSTALFFLAQTLLHLQNTLMFYLSGLPTLTGWTIVFCACMVACCED